jgi:hypothetical protein
MADPFELDLVALEAHRKAVCTGDLQPRIAVPEDLRRSLRHAELAAEQEHALATRAPASQIDHTMLEPDTRSGSALPASLLAQISGIPSATTRSASSIKPFWMGLLW